MQSFESFVDKTITANKVVYIDGKTYTALESNQPLKKRRYKRMRIESNEEEPPGYLGNISELPLHLSNYELQTQIFDEVDQCDHDCNLNYNRHNDNSSDHAFSRRYIFLNEIRNIVREEYKSIIEPQITRYEDIVRELRMINKELTKESVKSFEKPYYLPIKTIKEFQETENLTSVEFHQLINYLSTLGGESIRDQVRNMISILITTELAVELSLSKHNNVGFSNTKLLAAIFVATQRIKPESSCTKESVLIIINRAVRCAKQKHRYHTQQLYKCKRRSGYTKKSI